MNFFTLSLNWNSKPVKLFGFDAMLGTATLFPTTPEVAPSHGGMFIPFMVELKDAPAEAKCF